VDARAILTVVDDGGGADATAVPVVGYFGLLLIRDTVAVAGGVNLVMSDAHSGLKKAISTVFQAVWWQRCRVHFMRNVLCVVPKGSQDMVASIIRTIFAQPDAEHLATQFDEVRRMLNRSHPKVAAMLGDAKDDLLVFTGFPQRH